METCQFTIRKFPPASPEAGLGDGFDVPPEGLVSEPTARVGCTQVKGVVLDKSARLMLSMSQCIPRLTDRLFSRFCHLAVSVVRIMHQPWRPSSYV